MKKLLLITSFLASQLFAVQCTEQQYSPYFTDKKEIRYLYSNFLKTDNSDIVIDKESITYDKKNQIITAWVISKTVQDPDVGYYKVKWEINVKNRIQRFLNGTTVYSCQGAPLASDNTVGDWIEILPNSSSEYTLKRIQNYLKIK